MTHRCIVFSANASMHRFFCQHGVSKRAVTIDQSCQRNFYMSTFENFNSTDLVNQIAKNQFLAALAFNHGICASKNVFGFKDDFESNLTNVTAKPLNVSAKSFPLLK